MLGGDQTAMGRGAGCEVGSCGTREKEPGLPGRGPHGAEPGGRAHALARALGRSVDGCPKGATTPRGPVQPPCPALASKLPGGVLAGCPAPAAGHAMEPGRDTRAHRTAA